ncbi:diaminopimelate decarboxylase [Xanthomonas arboricola]|uniref:Type III PLP-dependent enzyme n=1 Tax=Xanthomonas campestris pv. juglandis TaxID=195709 RepID=A0A8E4EIU4_XANCJ|nr:type III PLP-dependent enzyme [Xanthomonas arboricola]KOA96724.1 diaminopimelate decarboxylase [Xanthomonas arboricola]KOB02062.1 diaminopimelate decarboxylase [Xanthomonas arboricola]KOB05223.1 diaminopimelate decarboxylase [Xanthomonas arboricola]KOB11077.1 diaminopimelate decarboxylase [Xanthomonas arboricola]KOB14665.1 diaminopimelate decarboxylase [Xanthomonas arboricola]
MSLRIDMDAVMQALPGIRDRSDGPLCAYVYDLAALDAHAAWMRAQLPADCELFYAAKANAEPPILQTLAPHVDGFEAASGGELAWLHRQQPQAALLFGGPGKLDGELAQAVALPDCTVHVESLGELERLATIAAQAGRCVPVFLRMNIAVPGAQSTRLMMGGQPSPFGLDPDDLDAAIQRLRASPSLWLEGFHFHLMSHQRDAGAQLHLIAAYLHTVQQWRQAYALGPLRVNAGGGFGVDYLAPESSFDWAGFCAGLPALLREHGQALRLRLEPGRYVSASCGWYLMDVLDLKRSHGAWFAIARGGTHHFRTPAAQGHDHPFRVLRGRHAPVLRDTPVTLVGQLCTPKDVLARNQPIAALAPGDCLAFPLAGAYAWNISHQQFLMHPPPQMVFLPVAVQAAASACVAGRTGTRMSARSSASATASGSSR